MKKQGIMFLVMAVVCAACVGGYFFLKNHEFKSEETTAVVETVVTDFDKEQVVRLTVTGEYNYDLVKEGEEWTEASIPGEKIDASKVNLPLSQIYSIETTESVIEAPEDLSEYGLDEPRLSASVVFEDGTEMTFHFGSDNELVSKDYFQVEGDPNVYLVAYYIDTYFSKVPEDFIAEEETETAETAEEAAEAETAAGGDAAEETVSEETVAQDE